MSRLPRVVTTCGLAMALLPALSVAQSGGSNYLAPWFGSFERGGAVITMTPWEDGIKMVITAGPDVRMVAFARMDGKNYPETGNQRSDGLIFNPIDENSYEFVGTKNGEIVVRTTITFPPDRMTRVSTTTFLFGEQVNNLSEWKRVVAKSDEPWAGIWQAGETSFIMEPWEDGFTFILNSPPMQPGGNYIHASGFGRFDGKEYHETGNPFADSLVFNRIDEHSYEVKTKKDGELMRTTKVTFSKDGKTRTSVATAPDGKTAAPVVWQRVE